MARTFAVSLELWLAALFAVVLFRLMTGGINAKGLLVTNLADLGAIRANFDRFQHLWATVAILAAYVAQSIGGAGAAMHTHKMPDISPALIAGMVGTHAVYLGGKIVRNL